MPQCAVDLIETGAEPEFFITTIAKFEPMGNGMIRIYLATEKGESLRLEYTAIVAATALEEMGRACLSMATASKRVETIATDALH